MQNQLAMRNDKTNVLSRGKYFILASAVLLLINIFFMYPAQAQAVCENQSPMTVVLDAGHNPNQQGALGVRGIYEVVYNDHLATQIADALRNAGVTVILTRTPTQKITLDRRAQIANTSHADLFLAIHHDSAQAKYSQKTTYGQLAAYQSTKPIAGYSVFVSKRNPQFDNSYSFAKFLGQNMLQLGRLPATHHAENIPGENRKFLDPQLGIYEFDDLIVLRKTTIPAVLLEIGVIIDANDEKYISDKNNQQAMVRAIVTAVQEYGNAMCKKRFNLDFAPKT